MIQTLELVIQEHPFFHGLSDEHLDFITGCAKNVQFPEKHVMFTEGDPADGFYFIRKGAVSVELMVQNSGPRSVQTWAVARFLAGPGFRRHTIGILTRVR